MGSDGLLHEIYRKKQVGRRPIGTPIATWERRIGVWIVECRHCGVEKTSGEFRRSSQTMNGLQPYCRECLNELRRMKRRRVYDVRDATKHFAKNVVADHVGGGESGDGV